MKYEDVIAGRPKHSPSAACVQKGREGGLANLCTLDCVGEQSEALCTSQSLAHYKGWEGGCMHAEHHASMLEHAPYMNAKHTWRYTHES